MGGLLPPQGLSVSPPHTHNQSACSKITRVALKALPGVTPSLRGVSRVLGASRAAGETPGITFTSYAPPVRCSRLSVAALTTSRNLRGSDSTLACLMGALGRCGSLGTGAAGPILLLRPGRCLCLHGLRLLTPALYTLGWLRLDGPGGQGPALRGHALDHPRALLLTPSGQNRVTRPPQQW